MNVSFELRKASSEAASVRVLVTHKGKVYRRAVGISVKPSQWKNGKATDIKTATALKKIRIGLEYCLDETSSEEDVRIALGRVRHGKWCEDSDYRGDEDIVPTFWEYFKTWSDGQTGSAARQVQMTYRKVLALMGEVDWDELTDAWYERLVDRLQSQGLSVNYIGTTTSRVRTCVAKAYKLGYHTNQSFMNWTRRTEKVYAVYLTDLEARKVMEYKSSLSVERKTVGLFTIGYKTGARYSDFSRLSLDNIVNGRIVFRQQKTTGKVVIPASPDVVRVLNEWGGAAPRISEQQYNKVIKEVCRKVGINDMIEVVKSEGKRHIRETKYKWELVSSHTCRRSCITNLYLSGVSAKECMVISGHSSLSAFEKYLKMTNEETVEKLSSLEFFN